MLGFFIHRYSTTVRLRVVVTLVSRPLVKLDLGQYYRLAGYYFIRLDYFKFPNLMQTCNEYLLVVLRSISHGI